MFSIPTKTRYGLRALVQIAGAGTEGPVSLPHIATQEDVSVKYLEQIMAALKKAGLVRSIRGPEGGYCLDAEPAELSVYDIASALDGPLFRVPCFQDPPGCGRIEICATHVLWQEMKQQLEGFLRSRTLADLVKSGSKSLEPAE